jgi:hypothetical protein
MVCGVISTPHHRAFDGRLNRSIDANRRAEQSSCEEVCSDHLHRVHLRLRALTHCFTTRRKSYAIAHGAASRIERVATQMPPRVIGMRLAV